MTRHQIRYQPGDFVELVDGDYALVVGVHTYIWRASLRKSFRVLTQGARLLDLPTSGFQRRVYCSKEGRDQDITGVEGSP